MSIANLTGPADAGQVPYGKYDIPVDLELIADPRTIWFKTQQFPLASSRGGLFCDRLLRDEFFPGVANRCGEKRRLGGVGSRGTSRADTQGALATVPGRSERRNSS